jgi:hypothetical protein
MIVEESVSYSPETDILAPAQFFSHFGGTRMVPEERLMLAVLNDAIDCVQEYAGAADGKRERLFLLAMDWVSNHDSDWPFSFENICDTLRLDPNYVRRGLLTHQRLEARARLHAATPHRHNLPELYLSRSA